MTTPVITVENIGKKYRLGLNSPTYSLKDTISQGFGSLFVKTKKKENNQFFWALNDISFTVEKGDALGIIGRNGAGKSTLLKILSRITSPTTGNIVLTGRVGSLLEVGTGFHPELSGRENIRLSGSLLGMKKTEIDAKFDEIVKFSEIEKFLDTPVKRYSSGMYVRLAFAVAAHLDPEILLVDEVLAVGDIQFQKKCLGKMGKVANEGRTILFVSHNMNAIEDLCNTCILLDKGEIIRSGSEVRDIAVEYLNQGVTHKKAAIWKNSNLNYENDWFQPLSFFLSYPGGSIVDAPIRNDQDVYLNIVGIIKNLDPSLTIGYALYSSDNLLYWSYPTDCDTNKWPNIKKGTICFQSKLPKRLLNEGDYRIELIGGLHFRLWLFEPGSNNPNIYFSIQGGLSESPYWMVKRPGLLGPIFEWTCYDWKD